MKSLKDYEYYRTALGVLYCGDNKEILPLITEPIDLVLTDPPYGMEYHSNRYKDTNPHDKIEGDNRFPIEIFNTLKPITKKAIFMFCRWDNLKEVEKPKSFIVWHKNNWAAGDLKHEYGRMWEGILFYPMSKHEFYIERQPDIIKCDRVSPDKLTHPTEKPLPLLTRIIQNNTLDNDVVLDCFAGSGSTLHACLITNRKFIGIEISEKYCEIAKKRIEIEASQVKLF